MKTIQRLLPLLLLFIVASCVQVASEDVAPTQVGNVASFTPVPTITPTGLPTEIPTDVVETVEVVVEVEAATEDVTPLNEPTEAALAFVTDTPIPSITPSNTPTLTATSTFTPIPTATSTQTPGPTPTEAVAGLVQPEGQDDGVQIQQDPPPQDPAAGGNAAGVTDFELTATQLIVNATDTAATATRQAEIELGIGDSVPTETPFPQTDGGGDNLGDGQGVVVTQPPVAIQPGADCVHEVRAVDRSLYRLSLAYGVTVNQIAAASGIVNPDLIRIGQRLTIPGCGTTGGRPPATSTPGPNDNNIGGPGVAVVPGTDCTFGTSVLFPGGCPDGSTPNTSGSVGTTTGTGVAADTGGPTTGTGSGTVVRVQQGETLFEISLRTGVPVASIAAANGITDFDRIFLNQELIIP